MRLFAFIDILGMLIAALIGSYIFAKDSYSRINKIFFINTLLVIYTSLCEYFFITAPDIAWATFWQKISILWPFFPAIFLQFVLALTNSRMDKNKIVNYLLWAPAFIIASLHAFTDLLYSGLAQSGFGWRFIPTDNILSFFITLYFSICGITSWVIVIKHYFIQTDKNKRNQLLLVFIGVAIPVVSGVLSKAVLPQLGYEIPPINSFVFVVSSFFLAVGILKYKVFLIEPVDAIKRIFAATPDYFIIFNQDEEILLASDSFLNISGFNEEEMLGKKIDFFFRMNNTPAGKALLSNTNLEIELYAKTSGKEEIPISATSSVMQNNLGTEKAYLLLGRDLRERKRLEKELVDMQKSLEERVKIRTAELAKANQVLEFENNERKKFESALRNSESRIKDLFENAPIGIYRTTPGGEILLANPAIVKMLGYNSFEELTKRNLEEEGYSEHNYSRDEFKRDIEGKGEIIGLQAKWVKKNGKEIIVRENAKCIYDELGKVLYYDGTVEDITDHIMVIEALKTSEERFRNLIENINEVYFITDKNGKTIYISSNVISFTGYPAIHFLGKSSFIQTYKEDFKRVYNFYLDKREDKTIDASIEFRAVRRDGTIYWVEQITRFIRDDEGNVIEYRSVVRDITERKIAEEILNKSEKKYKYLFENNPNPMWIYDLDTLGFMLVNEAAIKHYGYSEQEFLRMTLKDIRPVEDISILLEDVAKDTQRLNMAGVWRHKKKDGTIILVEIVSHYIEYENHRARLVIPYDITERKKAEYALKESEDKYRNLIENINEVYFITDKNGKTVYISSNVISFTGYPAIHFLNKSSFILTYKEDFKRVYNFYLDRREDKTIDASIEFRAVKKDGTIYWVEQITRFVRDDEENIIEYRSVVRDISERKRAEETANLLAQAVKGTSEGISITDLNNNIIFVNDAFVKIYGYERRELIGRNIEIVRSENNPDPLIEDIRKATINGSWYGELLNKKKNGTEFPIFLSASRVMDDKGEPYALVGVSRDITERKESEKLLEDYRNHLEILVEERTQRLRQVNMLLQNEVEKLKIAEENNLDQLYFLQTLIDTIPSPIFYRDSQKLYRGCNKAFEKFHGIPKEELMGKTVYLLSPFMAAKYVDEKDDELLNNPGEQTYEEVSIDNEGKTHNVIVSKATFFKSDGTVGGIVGTLIDITEIKKLESDVRNALEKEKELSELKSRFISVASHEFRTPLTSILASADLLEMYGRKWPESKYFEYVGIIQNSVEYMTELINDVLTVSKSDTGKIKFNPTEMNLYELVNNIYESVKLSSPEKIKFNFNYDIEEKIFNLDNKLITQILSNLLSNAVKYSPNGGAVYLDVKKENDCIKFSVSDEGIGISEEDLELMFEPFHRGNNVGAISGTGLGLSIAKKSAEIHNGNLIIESKLNEGTKITVTINCNKHT